MTALLIVVLGVWEVSGAARPARAGVSSGDAPLVQAPYTEYGGVKICVLAVCEDDPATEAAIKRAAEAALLRLKGVAVSDFLEESSVLISFVAFKERDAQGMQTGRLVYSFAYGTPDLDYADDVLIGLPRYLHHEPVIAAREMLEKTIADNIDEADRDFFHFLRAY